MYIYIRCGCSQCKYGLVVLMVCYSSSQEMGWWSQVTCWESTWRKKRCRIQETDGHVASYCEYTFLSQWCRSSCFPYWYCRAPLREIPKYCGSGCDPRLLPGSTPLGAAVQQRAIEGGFHGVDYWWSSNWVWFKLIYPPNLMVLW